MNITNQLGTLKARTFGTILRELHGVFLWAAHLIGVLTMIGFVWLWTKSPLRAFDFLKIGLTLWLVWELWVRNKKKSVPFLPALLLVEGMFYLMPLLAGNPGLDDYESGTLSTASLAVVVFFFAALAGWLGGIRLMKSRPSRFNFDFSTSGGSLAGTKLGLALLGLNVAFNALCFNGMIWVLIRGDAGLFSIVRSLADIAALGGAFFAGLLINRKEVPFTSKVFFVVLLVLVFAFSMSGLLLYSSVASIIAFSLGVLMRGGVPWKFLLTMACVLAFLNFGKFPMRAKYLNESGTGVMPGLTGLPSYYLEWANESLRLMGGKGIGAHETSIVSEGEGGQPIYYRIDEMGSLLFITQIMERNAIQPLEGQTYTIIPPLLIPRFLWPGKPIVHGGQVLLNLYFGRQQTIEQTEKTYVAWGWLPEAVGNFGIWPGAIFIGLVLGFVCGISEGWGYSVELFSIEGFVALNFLVLLVNSWGTAASIFATSAFQSTCSVLGGGYVIYLWLAKNRGSGAAAAQRRNVRPRRLKPATPNP